MSTSPAAASLTFAVGQSVVYPAHGLGKITAIEEQEVAGFKLDLIVVTFDKDRMVLRIPKGKAEGLGLRMVSGAEVAEKVLDLIGGRPKKNRSLWARRAAEFEAKIKTGDLMVVAEVVRDLGRPDYDMNASYSERNIYEAALERVVRELAAIRDISETEATALVQARITARGKAGLGDVEDDESAAA